MNLIAFRDPSVPDEYEVIYGFYNPQKQTVICGCCGVESDFNQIRRQAEDYGWENWYKFYDTWIDLTDYIASKLKMRELKNKL